MPTWMSREERRYVASRNKTLHIRHDFFFLLRPFFLSLRPPFPAREKWYAQVWTLTRGRTRVSSITRVSDLGDFNLTVRDRITANAPV